MKELLDILLTGRTPREIKAMKKSRVRVRCFLCQRRDGEPSVTIFRRGDAREPKAKVVKLELREFTLRGEGLTVRFLDCQECACVLRLLRGNEPGIDFGGLLKEN